MPSIDVSFTLPETLHRKIKEDSFIVVIDILRFTSTACAAFSNHLSGIIPVAGVSQARELKKQGYPVAGEQNGERLDFADYGNSPYDFLNKEELRNLTLVFCTTNGTRVIEGLKKKGTIVLGAFSNLNVLSAWLHQQKKHVYIQCAGWNDQFCIEDVYCAGALIEQLIERNTYQAESDTAKASLQLWQGVKNNLRTQVMKSEHYQRLIKLGAETGLDYVAQCNTAKVIPVMSGNKIINVYSE